MAKKCKKCECPAGEKWAVPLADMFSLLLALFIALFAIASVNKEKLAALKAAFVQVYDYPPKSDEKVPIIKMDAKPGETQKPGQDSSVLSGQKSIITGNSGSSLNQSQQSAAIAQAVLQVRKMIEDEKKGANVTLEESENGFVINLPASLAFRNDSAAIESEDALQFIRNVSKIAKNLPENTDIMVNGYTDDTPPSNASNFKDNWQLSSARAQSVVKELMKDGISGNKLAAVGYGEYRPLSANNTTENREKNRRVTISFVSKQDSVSPQSVQKSILDTAPTAQH
jgi:chemotaxis protein MotB